MDYRQKYIKYKSKYFALKQIAGGNKDPGDADAIEKLKGIAIPPELQALDNAFLPGFNIDSQYVDKLLEYSRKAIVERGSDITDFHCLYIIHNLRILNDKTNGLCEKGDRNNNKTVPKAIIVSNLENYYNFYNIINQVEALAFFATVDKIRNFPVENIATSTDIQITKLQALHNAFLPGFNIDSQYVDKLLQYSREAIANHGSEINNGHCYYIINNLIILNNNTNGLCEKGDRNNNITVRQGIIDTNLSKNINNNKENQINALKFFNDKIRNFPVENIATSTDIQVKKFQECDDYFVPGFNIDKAYVGHLIYYVLSMINNTDVLSVYTKMKALNKKLKLGINNKGDRLARTQKKLKKSEIKFTKNAKKEFSMDVEFSQERKIVNKNPSLFKSPI